MKNKNYIAIPLTYLTLMLAFSCEEVVIINLPETERKIVIEGLLTDEFKSHYIRVSQVMDFYESGAFPVVTDAEVFVTTDEGEMFRYIYNPTGEILYAGYYFSEQEYAGRPGISYSMKVLLGGIEFTAIDSMVGVTSIDSLGTRINEDEKANTEFDSLYWEVLLYASEPQEVKNYYLFNFYRNGQLARDDVTDIYAFDDTALGGSLDGLASTVFYANGDTATMEIMSLTRSGYIYFFDLVNILNNDSGFFSPPPTNPRSNISEGAVGIWQVSAVSRKKLVIK